MSGTHLLMEPPRGLVRTWPTNDCSGNLFRYRNRGSRWWSKLQGALCHRRVNVPCSDIRLSDSSHSQFDVFKRPSWIYTSVYRNFYRTFRDVLFASDTEIMSSVRRNVITIFRCSRILWRNLHAVILSRGVPFFSFFKFKEETFPRSVSVNVFER